MSCEFMLAIALVCVPIVVVVVAALLDERRRIRAELGERKLKAADFFPPLTRDPPPMPNVKSAKIEPDTWRGTCGSLKTYLRYRNDLE